MYHNTPPPLPPRPGQQSPTISPRSANNSFTKDGSSSPRTSRTCSLIDTPSVPPKPSQIPNKGSKPSNSDSPKLIRSPIRPSSLIVANTSIATPSLPKPFSDKNNTYPPTPLVSQANASIDFMPQNVLTSSQSRKKATIYEFIDPKNPEKLSDIVTDSTVLPMRVAFCESVYGLCESFTFSSNEFFDIHFLKESQFANITSSRGSMLKIPLQAPIQFTVNYSPDFTCDAEYEVPQLMKLYNLPTVALVKDTGTSSHSSRLKFRSNKSSEFVQGEMLVFKSRIKSSTIECFSLSQKETKRIHKSSELTLITNPSRSTFDFTDLIFFDVPLQIQIQAAPVKLKPRLISTSTIVSLTKEKSLITSFSDAKWINDDDPTNIPLYEIFIDAPIEFQRVYTLPKEKENLLKKSKQIFDNFSPHHVKLVVPNSNDNNSQKEPLYDFLTNRGDYGNEQLWRKVTQLFKPSMFSEMSSPTLCNMPEDQPEQIKEVFPTERITETSKVEYDYVQSVEWSGSVVHEPYVPMLSSKVSHDPPGSITSSPPVSIVHDSKAHQDILTTQTETDYVSGVHHLEDLSCDQVLDLLDKLGLSRYKNLFIEEKISGKLLQELDEEILEQDLGITSRLHRLKLKRVIDGRESLDGMFT